MTGKTIRIFLADAEPTGILLTEISNWTGKVLVAPRSQLDQLSKREEVRRTGICLLIGPDPDDPSRALASIGEGDNVLKRLLRHNKSEAKHFWERTVAPARRCVAQGACPHEEAVRCRVCPTPASLTIVIREQPSSPCTTRAGRATVRG